MLLRREGLVRLLESSMQSENLRAMLERIRHMSTQVFYVDTPQDHFYSSSNRMGTVQFQDLAFCCHRNFSSLEEDLLVSFLTTSLSLRKFLMASQTVPVAETGGSLSIIALGCSNSIFWRALVYQLSCFSSYAILLSLSLISSLSLVFQSLKTTSLSKMSEMCFLVGERASCSSLSFQESLLISVCRSVMMISYLRLVLASLYLMQRLMEPSSSEIMFPALLQRLVRFEESY